MVPYVVSKTYVILIRIQISLFGMRSGDLHITKSVKHWVYSSQKINGSKDECNVVDVNPPPSNLGSANECARKSLMLVTYVYFGSQFALPETYMAKITTMVKWLLRSSYVLSL